MRAYERIAAELQAQITAGVFRPGDKLPSVRTLRFERSVSMNTANEALAELERRGVAESRPRSGFYVRAVASPLARPQPRSVPGGVRQVSLPAMADHFVAASADPNTVPLGGAVVAPSLLPQSVLARIARQVLRREDQAFGLYGPPAGDLGLRRALARWSREWGLVVEPDDIVITSGCMDAIRLALSATTRPGALVALESPTFFGFLRLVRDLGHPVVEIPVDPASGLDLDALELACETHDIAALITTPTLHNPTGAVLSEADRARLSRLGAQQGFVIIEDDVYGPLASTPMRPVLSQDPNGRGILAGSLSKVVSPGLRVGYAISPRFASDLVRHKLSGTICSPPFNQAVLRDFLEEGRLARHVRRLRSSLERQRAALAATISRTFPEDTEITAPDGGFLLWMRLPGVDALDFHARALAEGVSVLPGPLCSASEGFTDCVRLSSGYPFTAAHQAAVTRLAGIVTR